MCSLLPQSGRRWRRSCRMRVVVTPTPLTPALSREERERGF
jgi:hypothetical protein